MINSAEKSVLRPWRNACGGGPVVSDLIDDGSGQTPATSIRVEFNGAPGGRTHM